MTTLGSTLSNGEIDLDNGLLLFTNMGDQVVSIHQSEKRFTKI